MSSGGSFAFWLVSVARLSAAIVWTAAGKTGAGAYVYWIMLNNLKLSHQGLILLLVPLICEVVFVCALVYQFHQFEQLGDSVDRARHYRIALNDLMLNAAELGADIDYLRKNSEMNSHQFQKRTIKIRNHVRAVVESKQALIVYSPDVQTVADIERICQPLLRINGAALALMDAYDASGVAGFKAMIEQEESAPNHRTIVWRGQATEALRQAAAAKREDSVDYSAKVAEADKAFRNLLVLIGVGMVAHVIVAWMLWVNFSRGTAYRFAILIDNTRRLSRGLQPNPPLGGKGEIAHLDAVFQDMARSLAESAQYKKDMIAIVSQDLRSPLTSVSGFLELLSTGMIGNISEAGRQSLTAAETNVKRLIRLINDLLDMERLESGKLDLDFQEVPLASVFERSAQAATAFAGKQGVELKVEPTELVASMDSDRIVQVLVNLVSNAVKFSAPGSTVVVKAEERPQSVEIKVIDRGRGIPAEFRNKIFERFQQVERSDAKSKGGSGLGLSICKAIIEGHHGQLGVESELGQGSTFWFEIPKTTGGNASRTVERADRHVHQDLYPA